MASGRGRGAEGRKQYIHILYHCVRECGVWERTNDKWICDKWSMWPKVENTFYTQFWNPFSGQQCGRGHPRGGGGIYPKDISNYEGRRESGEAAPLIASSDISSPTVFGQKLASLTLAFPLATPSVFTCFSPNFPAFLLTSPPGCVFCYANFSGIFQTNGEAQQQIFRFCKWWPWFACSICKQRTPRENMWIYHNGN